VTVDLLQLDERALARLYADRIQPILQANEDGRKAAVGTFYARIVPGAAVALAATIGVYYWWDDAFPALLFGAAVISAAHWFAMEPIRALSQSTKEKSLTAIAQAIGCHYTLVEFTPDAFARFTEHEMVPGCDRSAFQDCFHGEFHGCTYVFYEGHLEKRVKTKNGERWDTVFHGQLIRVSFPKKFHGITVVRRDAGMFNFLQRWGTELQRVAIGDSRLEKAFEVYSNDQVEARYLIHPVFMERLLALETQFKGKKLRCAFEAGDLLIAIEGGDRFELGSMFRPLDDIARARAIIADIAELMRLIDAVLTAERGVLPQP
jgi:Protein of unknown function (DUF3137)